MGQLALLGTKLTTLNPNPKPYPLIVNPNPQPYTA